MFHNMILMSKQWERLLLLHNIEEVFLHQGFVGMFLSLGMLLWSYVEWKDHAKCHMHRNPDKYLVLISRSYHSSGALNEKVDTTAMRHTENTVCWSKIPSYGEIQHTPIYGDDEYMGGKHNKGLVDGQYDHSHSHTCDWESCFLLKLVMEDSVVTFENLTDVKLK